MSDEPIIPAQPESVAHRSPDPVHADPPAWFVQQEQIEAERASRQRRMLTRLRLVLVAALAAFCLVTWALVRGDSPLTTLFGLSGPSRVVRQHLEALNRGEAREAYSFFSTKYRGEIPLRGYERLVATHRDMFRTRVLAIEVPNQQDGLAILDARLAASSGAVYNARFTLVRANGRWWIDEVRWTEAPNPRNFTHA